MKAVINDDSIAARARRIREQSRSLVSYSEDVRHSSEMLLAHVNVIMGIKTVLWQFKRSPRDRFRCELDGPCEGAYRVRVWRAGDREPCLVETNHDRQDGIRTSITIYRRMKDDGT
jgi:hypothetical protein